MLKPINDPQAMYNRAGRAVIYQWAHRLVPSTLAALRRLWHVTVEPN
jgi:hypothetical protein